MHDDTKESAEEAEAGYTLVNTIQEHMKSLNDEKYMPVMKLVHAFKYDVGSRFSFKSAQDALAVRTIPTLQIQNNRARSIIPKDRRKYKEDILRDVVTKLTFSPHIPHRTINIAINREKKLLQERADAGESDSSAL